MHRMRSAWSAPLLAAAAVLLAVVGHATVVPGGPTVETPPPARHSPYIRQEFLVAVPSIQDPRFGHAVIYMVEHDAGGAFGLIVNHPVVTAPLGDLLKGFGIDAKGARDATASVVLNYGGPVESDRLFVIHTNDWRGPKTLPMPGPVSITPHPDILQATADGNGPLHSLVIFGYSGWGPGQLEHEMERGDWLTAPADTDLIFNEDLDADGKWQRARETAGIAL